jgi:hypothetical protein
MPRRRTLPKCVYCGQPGLGDPPLCRDCFAGVHDDEAGFEFEDLLQAVLSHPQVDEIFAALQRGAQDFVRRKVREFGGFASEWPPRPPGAAPPPPSSPPPSSSKEDPRTVLGFAPGVPLTRALIKQRQRALASMFHPDAGGSTAAMQRVNAAVEELLAELG